MSKILNKATELINHYRGWRTDEKIVVFESDDWGSIRTSSKYALSDLRRLGLNVDKCHYMLFDSLESRSDLESLFSVLSSHEDIYGQHPIFTFNTIVGNPEFDAIKQSQFQQYYYEPFHKTYEKLGKSGLIDLWKEGILAKVIRPQFHGREHVNIKRWLLDLQKGRKDTQLAFEHEMFGVSGHIVKEKRGSYLAVFDEQGENNQFIGDYISEGLHIFKETFGYSSVTFIPPNYIWNTIVEDKAIQNGVFSMQGSFTQNLPTKEQSKQGVLKHYVGEKSAQNGIGYLVRNVLFEPSSDLKRDWVLSAIKEIEKSFRMRKPAIIDTHRVNYMGSLNDQNRDNNLKLLDLLIKKILKEWPDVTFLSSDSLAKKVYRN